MENAGYVPVQFQVISVITFLLNRSVFHSFNKKKIVPKAHSTFRKELIILHIPTQNDKHFIFNIIFKINTLFESILNKNEHCFKEFQ